MRTLVHNYSSEISTEPRYITQVLNIVGEQSFLWNNDHSAFDVFDKFDPEVFLTHYATITNDIVKRLKGTEIKVLINATGATKEVLDRIVETVDNTTLFTNYDNSSLPVVKPCADIFLENVEINYPAYNISKLFVICNEKDFEAFGSMIDEADSYHCITPFEELRGLKKIDECLSIIQLSRIYNRYDNIVVGAPNQALYDAAYYGNGCHFYNKEIGANAYLPKEEVKALHTPFQRVSSLFNLIGYADIDEKIANQTKAIA